jgi:iduronate 2-sulfatase
LSAAERPNVLLICVDDLKPVLGCYGDAVVKSPQIDRLAARGVRFERAYCNQAVCSPSRNALLVGLRPQRLGIYDLATNFRKSVPDALTLPQHFRQHGYRTEALGKIFHVGHGNQEDAASWSVPHFSAKSIGYALPENKAELTREGALFHNQPAGNLPKGAAYEAGDVPDNAYGDGAIADEAIRRLEQAKTRPEEPFFLAVGFLKPHLPFCAPRKYWDLYRPEEFTLAALREPPEGAPDYAPQFGGELRNYKQMPAKGPIDEDVQRTLIHGYYACVSYMDAQLGRVLEALDANGFADNTLIVLWGDHGWHLGDHGMWCKHTNYEQATRIPLIIAGPPGGAVASGKTTAALAESVDVYPTLCELAGLPIPTDLDGDSLTTVLERPESTGDEVAYHVYPRGNRLGRAVRTARHRLIEWKPIGEPVETAEYELYDYIADPAETKNLAAEQPTVVAKLRELIERQPEAKPQIKPQEPAATSTKASPDRAAMFQRRDVDGDGKLTKAEFLDKQPDPDAAPARFVRFDKNQDGALSRDEFVNQGK